jgi:hypothetical protein
MKSAWRLFEENKRSFEEVLYTTDEAWDRREARLSLFVLLDEAVQVIVLVLLITPIVRCVIEDESFEKLCRICVFKAPMCYTRLS